MTAEHVPPESFEGRELVLTCGPCNHSAGFGPDAEARARENPIDALRGRTARPVKLTTSTGLVVYGTFERVGENNILKMPPEKKNANRPGAPQRFIDHVVGMGGTDRTFTMTFHADTHRSKPADVSWLRSAYLTMFAVVGYQYAFEPTLTLVRRQIQDPRTEHIPAYIYRIPGDWPWSLRQLVQIHKPDWLRCWAIRVGPYLVFLPRLNDVGLYNRVAAARQTGYEGTFQGHAFEWPTEPLFGLPPESV